MDCPSREPSWSRWGPLSCKKAHENCTDLLDLTTRCCLCAVGHHHFERVVLSHVVIVIIERVQQPLLMLEPMPHPSPRSPWRTPSASATRRPLARPDLHNINPVKPGGHIDPAGFSKISRMIPLKFCEPIAWTCLIRICHKIGWGWILRTCLHWVC